MTTNSQSNEIPIDQSRSQEELPLVCDMTALTSEQRQRHQDIYETLQKAKESVQELTDGYAVQYPGDEATLRLATEFIVLEHLCCPFFRLTVEVEPGYGPIWLRLTGNGQVKRFIQAEMGF